MSEQEVKVMKITYTEPISIEVKRKPRKDVWRLGGLSPTALAHDYGVLVDEDGNPLEPKIRELRDLMDSVKDILELVDKVKEERRDSSRSNTIRQLLLLALANLSYLSPEQKKAVGINQTQ